MTFSDEAFVGGISDPLSAQYKHRRGVLDLVDKLHSYGYGQPSLHQSLALT
jgi:hypothetical protein